MSSRTRHIVWWYRVVLVSAFSVMALLMASLVVRTSIPAALGFVGPGFLLLLAVAIRSWQLPVVVMDDTGIALRSILRTRHLSWSEIRDVGVARGTSAALLPWRVPYFELTDDAVITADEIRSLREPSVVDDVVADARRHLGRP